MSPCVSVVLPVFNAIATLPRAIASIRAQTFTDWELVVVDDGSNDGSAALIAAAATADQRVRMIACAHGGLVAALTAGLAEARGEFIARMDADDVAHPERLAEQVAFLRAPANAEIGVVSCEVEFAGDRNANAGYALHVDWVNSLTSPEAIALNRFVESPLAHPTVMFRRALLEAHGGYRAGDFPEDYELWLRWLDEGVRFAKVPRVLLCWHDRPERLSRTDPRYETEAFFRAKAPWIARWLRARGLGETAGAARATPARQLYVWGAGRPTRKRAALLEAYGVRIAGFIDVDAKKATPALGGTGRPVLAMDAIPAPAGVFVLGYVASRGARDFIRAALHARGYAEGRDFLMCA